MLSVISDYRKHNSYYAFQSERLAKLGILVLNKIYYFTDGASAQYKNRKNFCNLAHHLNDFGIEAELHFFASAHGKGSCDGVGGTTKRLARPASLKNAVIITAKDLFEWVSQHIQNITYFFVPYTSVDALLKAKGIKE